MRIAVVHDWLITWRGGEKVLDALIELMPGAEVFTLFHEPGAMSARIEARPIHTAWLDRIPGARRRHRHFLPAFPAAIRSFDFSGFDLIVSSSHCVAKGVRVPNGVPHLSYVHAPLRYMWDRFDDYFGPGRAPVAVRAAALALRPALRAWDVSSSSGVSRFVANSAHVARQIAQRYGAEARVVFPPVELERFLSVPLSAKRDDYFLCLGALAPYKRVDLAISAFEKLGLPLWIAGSGQESFGALPSNVRALGQVDDAEVVRLMANARALVFPGEEDFGITPIEAMACGTPVIALGRGGALETVTEQTGVFFGEQTVEGLAGAVRAFEAVKLEPQAARAQAARFSRGRFFEGIKAELKALGVTLP